MNIIKKISFITLLGAGMAMPCLAEIVVIVNPGNTSKIDQEQIRNIFLGKVKAFDNGVMAHPYDIAPGNASRKEFMDKIMHKDESSLNSYWARMLFSSKGRPPEEVANGAEMLKAVSLSKSAIGYVDVKDVNDSVKVVTIVK